MRIHFARRGLYQAREQGLFELPVGVDLNGVVFGRDRCDGVLTEVKARLRNGKGCFPACRAEIAVIVLVGLFASGDEAKTPWPAKTQVVKGKLGSISEMRIPAFAGTHEENIVANVLDDVAAVANPQREGVAGSWRAWQEDAKSVIAAGAKFLLGEALVLEISQGFAGGQGDALDFEDAGELKENDALTAPDGAEIDRGVAFEGSVVVDGCTDVVAQRFERKTGGRETRERIGSPDIKVASLVDDARLAKHEILPAHLIDQDVERSGDNAVDASVEKVARWRGELFDDDAEGVRGIELRDSGNPEIGERRVGGGLTAGTSELREKLLRGVVCEAHVDRDKLLVENGGAEKTGQLLLFDRIPREGKGVAESGEDHAGDAALERFVKGKLSLFEGEDDIGLTELNAVSGRDGVNLMRVKAKGIERGQQFAGSRAGRRAGAGHGKKTSNERSRSGQGETHTRSVVTFGMTEQGGETHGSAEV